MMRKKKEHEFMLINRAGKAVPKLNLLTCIVFDIYRYKALKSVKIFSQCFCLVLSRSIRIRQQITDFSLDLSPSSSQALSEYEV